MPIGLVSDVDFELELARHIRQEIPTADPSQDHTAELVIPSIAGVQSDDAIPEVVSSDRPGRRNGDVNVPDSLRRLIGETALMDGRSGALALAREMGVSPSSASAYAKGATSTTTYNNPTQSIIGHINKARQRAIKRASRTLNSALGSITQDKLDVSDAKELAGVAKDMSVIIKNLEPPTPPQNPTTSNSPQFVIYAPSFKKEEHFETIHLSE